MEKPEIDKVQGIATVSDIVKAHRMSAVQLLAKCKDIERMAALTKVEKQEDMRLVKKYYKIQS